MHAMTKTKTNWPVKKRDIHNHHMDSTYWDGFQFRNDDIIIGTHIKSGTTWVQQIVAQLLCGGKKDIPVAKVSPWIDLRFPEKKEKMAMVEAQTHRRFLKTHLPVDALIYSPIAKYIYIARDGRDVVWSMYNHHSNASSFYYETVNDTPGRVGPPLEQPVDSIRQYFNTWLENDGYPYWPYWENIKSWWDIRTLPNILLLHYGKLKNNTQSEISRIAKFLNIKVDKKSWPLILEHCSISYMREKGNTIVPLEGAFWNEGAKTFIYKGTNGRWLDTLTEDENERYLRKAETELGVECSQWLLTG